MSNSRYVRVLAPVGAAFFALAIGVAACSGGHSLVPSNGQSAALRAGGLRPHACVAGYTGSPSSPLQVVDRSGLTVKTGWPAIYVEVGTQYLTGAGALVNNPGASTVPPIAVSSMCSTFKIPASANRIFIAYGPGITGNDLNAPNLRTTKILFDWVESGGSGLINPNVNADQFALPIYGSAKDNNGNYYALGFNNKYAAAISAFNVAPEKSLIVCGTPGGGSPTAPSTAQCPKGQMVLRVLQPYFAVAGGQSSGAFQGFPDTFYGTNPTYMSKVGNYYHTAFMKSPGSIAFVPYITALPGQPVTTCVTPPGTPPPGGPLGCPTYTVDYASSSGKFTFTLKAGSPSTYPKTVTVSTGKNVHPFTTGDILGNVNLPPLNTSVASQVTFYLQKYLQVDLNRGVAMTAGYHPVLPKCMPHWNSPICYATNYYPKGQAADSYAGILHQYAVQSYVKGQTYGTAWPWTTAEPGGAYGFPYDDTMQQASLVTIPYQNGALPIKAFYLCVQPMVSTAKTACNATKP